ncbi:hypothetical protein GCM10009716_34000 [Streptomyces sodiiphilus]|uniref:NACHT domain-containing protein n=2 Tax=Streptomyces sodiiphilus TaxID=226217 RepID=A0ABP5AXL9_9ACTN
MLLASDEKLDAEQLVAWVGLFVSLAALAVSVAQLLPALPPPTDAAQLADDLSVSVREQWEEEVTARHLRVPRVIPLSWSATRRPVAAPPEETYGDAVDARILRLALNGRLEGDFDQAARRLAQGYRSVPAGRLVILGEPGSGKSVLAAMLTLGLLAERGPGAPVPVLLTLSSWDPVSESLGDWIQRTLGTAYYGGRTEIPRLLLRSQRLLPILDGLDEMPEASRRSAVRAVNESCGEGTGVVLTCRSAEYQDVIEGGSPVLRRAPVVELVPVSAADAVAYLKDVSWPAAVEWEAVFEHLRENPESPTAVAMSTPLALTLARSVYSNCERDPAELLDFDSSHAVEDHLLDHIITAAYAPAPGSGGQRSTDDWHRSAKRAEAYMTYLATYLHRHRERDLVWWAMSRRLSSRFTGLALGVIGGLLSALITAGVVLFMGNEVDSDFTSIPYLCAILVTVVWYAVPGDSPGRLSFRRYGSLGRLGKGFVAGLKLTVILLVLTGALFTVDRVFANESVESDLSLFVAFSGGACGIGLAFSLGLAVHAWLDAPPENSKKATPSGTLHQDRASSLIASLVAGVVFGLAAVPLFVLGDAVGFIAYFIPAHSPFQAPAADLLAERLLEFYAGISAVDFVVIALFSAVGFVLLLLLTRAWPRFLLVRLSLAVRRKLPWGLIRFLADARDKQLLRQSAGAYQFRHIRLQERLASRALAKDRSPRGRNGRRAPKAAITAAVAALLLVGLLAGQGRSADMLIETGEAEYMGFGPQDNTLITVDDDGMVRRWDVNTGEEVMKGGMYFPFLSYSQSHVVVIAEGLLWLDEMGFETPTWRLIPWREPQVKRGEVFQVYGDVSDVEGISSNGCYQLSMRRSELFRIDRKEPEWSKSCRVNSEEQGVWWSISGDG